MIIIAFVFGIVFGAFSLFGIALLAEKTKEPIKNSETVQELVDCLLHLMETDPDSWTLDKFKTEQFWFSHPSNGVFINTVNGKISGEKGSGNIPISLETQKKLYRAVCDLKAHRALRKTLRAELE